MARIRNVTPDTLLLGSPGAPPIYPDDEVEVSDAFFVGRSWPAETWEVVEPPTLDGAVEVPVVAEDAVLWLTPDLMPDTGTDLGAMTIAALTEYADAHGIDLGGASKKADIVAAIVTAEGGE